METTERALAKLNYCLDVTGRRDDGFHELAMVMGSVELSDEVRVELRPDGAFAAESNFPWVPRDDRNLGIRAAKAFFAVLGEKRWGVGIRMEKRVPVGAGMAGGSTDAAAVLRALDRLTGAGMGAEKLREIGLSVGSDVPYCVTGGMVLARGRGEVLTPLPELPECWIVIAKPAFSVSTAELFQRIDGKSIRTRPDINGMVDALERGDLPGVVRRMYNVFEDALPRKCREIFSIRSRLLDGGAMGAVMTGTGSAVFGLFDRKDRAESTAETLSGHYKDCFLTRAAPKIEIP